MPPLRRLAAPLAAALLVACGGGPSAPAAAPVPALRFDESPAAERPVVWRSAPDAPYLTTLRTRYGLDAVVAGAATDFERVRAVSRWARTRWEHNGDHVAQPADPISILVRAERGERFRCVEYAIVVAGALNALGVPARVLGLKTADVETREVGAGHVVAEAYLRDRGKWVLVDGQWDAIPMRDGVPLDAVELQRALAEGAAGLSVTSISRTDAPAYFRWTAPYLYYFDYALDQRVGEATAAGSLLMLVPLGAPRPRVFQRVHPLGAVTYTSSLATFYAAPGAP